VLKGVLSSFSLGSVVFFFLPVSLDSPPFFQTALVLDPQFCSSRRTCLLKVCFFLLSSVPKGRSESFFSAREFEGPFRHVVSVRSLLILDFFSDEFLRPSQWREFDPSVRDKTYFL